MIGDAINNIGVIIAALVIWLTHYQARFYADPGVSAGIGLFIISTAMPLGAYLSIEPRRRIKERFSNHAIVKRSGSILLQSSPPEVDPSDVKSDLEMVSNTFFHLNIGHERQNQLMTC